MNLRLYGTDLHSQFITKELVYYMFVRNYGQKEYIFIVLMSFL